MVSSPVLVVLKPLRQRCLQRVALAQKASYFTTRRVSIMEPSVKLHRAFLPTFVLLSFSINEDLLQMLQIFGVTVVHQTPKRNAEIREAHIAAAQHRRIDPFRMDRKMGDDKSVPVPDSGVQVFGKDGAKNVTPRKLVSDLMDLGYTMQNVHILRRPRDGKHFLRVGFERLEEGEQPFELSSSARLKVEEFLDTVWSFCHTWRNPDASATFNFGGPYMGNAPKKHFALRMDGEGHMTASEPVIV